MRRKAFTLTEALIALALLALIFSLLYGFVHTARQQEERAARTLTAVAHAQRAADTLSSDLRSIVPPPPTGGQHVMKIEVEGRTITFLRTEMKNGQMIASPVTYRASPTGRWACCSPTSSSSSSPRRATRASGCASPALRPTCPPSAAAREKLTRWTSLSRSPRSAPPR